ncbi:hypothetical protein NL676_014680 [Syzygium grande]|nr:hypothetical protein NL676_014680 [Syzygium grande]
MANGNEKKEDSYAVLGLKDECTAPEVANAYKKLALRWHPDRCSALGTSEFAKEAKAKFKEIQQAYSVLSDVNKRFLYDIGAYHNEDGENIRYAALALLYTRKCGGRRLGSAIVQPPSKFDFIEARPDFYCYGHSPV